MSAVVLTEDFLAKIAGWEAMKQARGLLENRQVLSSNWSPPILKGVVQEGSISYRAGLVLKDSIDLENMCSCRASRQWGTICAHSVAVGLHHLRGDQVSRQPTLPTSSSASTRQVLPPGIFVANRPAQAKAGLRLQRTVESGPAGEPAEIFVILPPNLGQAVSKGKVMVCFEGKWKGGRSPLNALPLKITFQFSDSDLALLAQIEQIAEGETPAMLMLSSSRFAQLLDRLTGHPRITLGKSQPVAVSSEPWRVPVTAKLEASGEICLSLSSADVRQAPTLISGETSWIFQKDQLRPLGLPRAYLSIFEGVLRLPRNRVPQFLNQDWTLLQAHCELTANFSLRDFVLEPQAPRFLLALTGGLAQLHAQLQCAYGPRIMTVGVTSQDESLWLPDPNSKTRYSTRDVAAEQGALARLFRSGFTGPDAQGRYQVQGQDRVLNFLAREYPRLEKEWEVTLEERLERSTKQNLERIEPRFQITPSGEQWFDLDVSYASSSGDRFSASEIQRLVRTGQSHTRLKNGRIALIDTGAVEELQEVLLDCAPQQHDKGYRLANAQAGFLEASVREQTGWTIEAPSQWRERAAKQSGQAKLETPPLGELENVLRPYQKQGVAWLQFLRENRFGGILADEMGLGKTLQALALLQSIASARTSGRGAPWLVVCPTSLVFNWIAEAGKFTPRLRVLALHGAQRHDRFAEMASCDLVVTSYALIRRDAEQYRQFEFDTVVLDEAQHIKNRATQNAQAVKAIRAGHRLVLTGTPLENSVLDLWSIFDFLMPGYLGSAQDFRERYEVPIAREKNPEAQARLARRVRPFVLRRLKRDVAQDLPAKIEQISFCELTEDQRSVYQQVLEAGRREVVEAVGAQGIQKSRMVVLTTLLRLRQICCDLRLLKLENIDPATASGKVDLFDELLEEVLDGGHRVLVFSQFVSMLSLLKERLTAEAIEYCYLDGSTSDRAGVVNRFQQSPAIPVFLISLKAGGVGLNLTGADTVIHFDPWWNPAVEDQATDRAHRIGQTRVVTSYKLIARGTVEEKILNLQSRKREITKNILSGEEQFAEALSWEEIQELLA
jgi:superfamily II DNA or RNA helicase